MGLFVFLGVLCGFVLGQLLAHFQLKYHLRQQRKAIARGETYPESW